MTPADLLRTLADFQEAQAETCLGTAALLRDLASQYDRADQEEERADQEHVQ